MAPLGGCTVWECSSGTCSTNESPSLVMREECSPPGAWTPAATTQQECEDLAPPGHWIKIPDEDACQAAGGTMISDQQACENAGYTFVPKQLPSEAFPPDEFRVSAGPYKNGSIKRFSNETRECVWGPHRGMPNAGCISSTRYYQCDEDANYTCQQPKKLGEKCHVTADCSDYPIRLFCTDNWIYDDTCEICINDDHCELGQVCYENNVSRV